MNGQDTTVILKGVVIRSDDMQTAADLAASIYLIQNQDRPDGEWDDLPAGVTSDDVVRAIARQRAKRDSNRSAIDAHKRALETPIPRHDHDHVDARPDRLDSMSDAQLWAFSALALIVFAGPWVVGSWSIIDWLWSKL